MDFPESHAISFRHSRLRQRLFESASRAGVLRESAEQSADGLLHAGNDRERCAATRAEDSSRFVFRNRTGVAQLFPMTTRAVGILRGERIAAGTRAKNSSGNAQDRQFESLDDFKRRVLAFERRTAHTGGARRAQLFRGSSARGDVGVEEATHDDLLGSERVLEGSIRRLHRRRKRRACAPGLRSRRSAPNDDAGACESGLRDDEPDDRTASDETFA